MHTLYIHCLSDIAQGGEIILTDKNRVYTEKMFQKVSWTWGKYLIQIKVRKLFLGLEVS